MSRISSSEDNINNTLKTDVQIKHNPYYPSNLFCISIKADPKIPMELQGVLSRQNNTSKRVI